MSRKRQKTSSRANAEQLEGKTAAEAEDEDDLYQYPKTGSGPIFASIETILRCGICREISEPPLSLPCCQEVFCSLCIRQYLAITTPRCPVCRRSADPHDLILSKELRSVCSLWKRNRRTFLAAAKVVTTGASGQESVDASVSEEGTGAGSRHRGGAVGPGQGRNGGRLNAIHYHSTKDGQLRKMLAALGLPTGGSKADMSARHSRLVLLDTSSRDREVPLPRSELIRQVAVWERGKAREKAAAAKMAQSTARSAAVLSASSSSSASRLPGEAGGDAGSGAGGEPAAAAAVALSPKMNEGFAALIAQAKANAAKKRLKPSSESTDDAGSKRPRGEDSVQEGSASDNVSVGTAPSVGLGLAGDGSVANRHVSVANGHASVGTGLVGNGVVRGVGGNSLPSTALVPDAEAIDDSENALVTTTAGGNGGKRFARERSSAEAEEMRIMGVAGRMIRTRGPWRCVFSKTGTTPPPPESREPHRSATTGVSPSKQEDEPAPLTTEAGVSDPCSSSDGTGVREGGACRYDGAGLEEAVVGAKKVGAVLGSSGGPGEEDVAAAAVVAGGAVGEERSNSVVVTTGGGRGSGSGVGSDVVMSEAVSGEDVAAKEGKVVDVGDDRGVVGSSVDAVVEQGEDEEEYFVYLNTITGEATREPPPELVAQSEQAEQAGDFLIFVPSHSFVVGTAAAASGSTAALASSAWKPASALASTTGSISEAAFGASFGGGKVGDEREAGARVGGRLPVDTGDGYLQTASTPTEASSHARQHTSAGGGGEAWHRLGSVSETRRITPIAARQSSDTTGATPSRAPAAPAAAAGNIAKTARTPPVEASSPTSLASAPAVGNEGSSLPLTIDLSEASAVTTAVAAPMGASIERRSGDGLAAVATGGAMVGGWACTVCTLQNAMGAQRCEVCCAARPKSSGSKTSSSSHKAVSGSASRYRGESKLRLPARRNNAPQSTITAFASRPSGDGASTDVSSGGCGSLPRSVEASSSTPTLLTAARTGFTTVRSSERSAALSAEASVAKKE